MRYDPSAPPDPQRWLGLTEDERIDVVLRHHRRTKVKLPAPRMHAALHVMVENQLAEGYEAAVAALARLTASGLQRHEAIHAIASVAIVQMHASMQGGAQVFDTAAYDRELAALTAERWLNGMQVKPAQ
jgi:hypothetical protein